MSAEKNDPPADDVRQALEKSFSQVRTAEQADKTLHDLEEDFCDHQNTASPASELAGAARTIAAVPEQDRVIFDDAVSEAAKDEGTAASRRGRSLLRERLLHHLKPVDALDARLFLQINRLPHPPVLDHGMSRLSLIMKGGIGWLLVLAAVMMRNPQRGLISARRILPALWLTTLIVEHPVKYLFRRRRPFFSMVEAVVVGRKPGSYSFPSGHSAAALAGAVLLAKEYPRQAGWFYALAVLVGFSRVYLGAHYPGDVVSGGGLGLLLARLFRRAFQKRPPDTA